MIHYGNFVTYLESTDIIKICWQVVRLLIIANERNGTKRNKNEEKKRTKKKNYTEKKTVCFLPSFVSPHYTVFVYV